MLNGPDYQTDSSWHYLDNQTGGLDGYTDMMRIKNEWMNAKILKQGFFSNEV